jgi:UPF0271 protein
VADRAAGSREPLAALDVNVDMGESFGRWTLGDDVGIMPHVTSVSIACGFHAGDPATMRHTVEAALEHNLQIGAHVGLPDLLGFGRRRMAVAPDDLRDYTTYQIGALQAFVTSAGGTLSHVKPHGACYAMTSADPDLAGAVAAATAAIDPGLILLLLNDRTADAVAEHGIRLVTEAFVDLEYHPDGTLAIEPVKRAWDPERVAERTLRFVRERVIDAEDGSDLEIDAPTVCIHGDAPNAVEIAATVKRRLLEADVRLAPLAETLNGNEGTQ